MNAPVKWKMANSLIHWNQWAEAFLSKCGTKWNEICHGKWAMLAKYNANKNWKLKLIKMN